CCIEAVCDPNAGDAIGELRLLQRAMDAITASVVEQHERERERARPALEQLATAALESTSLDDLLHHLVAVLLDTPSTVDTAAILLVEGNRLRVRAAAGLGREVEEGFTLAIGEGFAGAIAAQRRPLTYSAGTMSASFASPILREAGIRALYGMPLVY